MASGDALAVLLPLGYEPPAASYATLDTRNSHPVLDFDGLADEEAVWTFHLPPNYAGGGITVRLLVAFTTATSGDSPSAVSRWQADIERLQSGTTDISSDSFTGSFQSAGLAAPATAGIVTFVDITFTDGAQMDSLAAGEVGRLKIRRDADGTSGTDDIATDAELVAVVIVET